MSFIQIFNSVEICIQISVKNKIINNHISPELFRLWLKYEAREDIAYIYQKEFIKRFRNHMNDEVIDQLGYAGKNLVYAILAFINKSYDINILLEFVESFITEQLKQFENDYTVDWIDNNGQITLCDNPT